MLQKKPPSSQLSKNAHQIEREYEVTKAPKETDVPVPKTYGFCENPSVIGTPFYIMEFLDGRVFKDPWLPDQTPRERQEISGCYVFLVDTQSTSINGAVAGRRAERDTG